MALPPYIIKDNSSAVVKAINELARQRIYVGIPSTDAGRTDTPLTNAVIGYLMEHGIPDRNVPARPFLVPGVRSVQLQTIAGLKRAANYAVEGNQPAVEAQMMAVGMRAVSAVQGWIRKGIPPPLAVSTMRARLRKTKSGRTKLKKLRQAGTDLYTWGSTNLTPLLDTSQLLKAITFVIRRT